LIVLVVVLTSNSSNIFQCIMRSRRKSRVLHRDASVKFAILVFVTPDLLNVLRRSIRKELVLGLNNQ
jgi:hypothetical protein